MEVETRVLRLQLQSMVLMEEVVGLHQWKQAVQAKKDQHRKLLQCTTTPLLKTHPQMPTTTKTVCSSVHEDSQPFHFYVQLHPNHDLPTSLV
ncbi:predicted protein [Thalassiosira pseudonana CCMP1335]|uniref:Uncharacterized protein n=1 Tax=Thalassiosira pseudonana TaxID=35128 RepID=B8C0Z0_THAPS|nr:predicted protein [Thalassiosira pseudonana CCMP1335]EED93147.1 predicted protein [Thalassiosira pseudonana CCMP1335]